MTLVSPREAILNGLTWGNEVTGARFSTNHIN